MKTKIKKEFDAVKYMRQQKVRISKEIAELNFEELKEYFKKSRTSERIIPEG